MFDNSNSGIMRAYIFLDGISCGLGIGDAVLHDGTFSMFPANRESTGGGVIHAHVSWATTGHWARKHGEKCITLCCTFPISLCLCSFTFLLIVLYWKGDSFNTPAHVLTCLSGVTDSWSFTITIQGNHSHIVISVWDQLLQQGRGGGSWYQNLHGHTP